MTTRLSPNKAVSSSTLTEVAVHLFHPRELALAVAEPDVNLLTYESIVEMLDGA